MAKDLPVYAFSILSLARLPVPSSKTARANNDRLKGPRKIIREGLTQLGRY
jgi:hypothetical protein